MSLSRPLRNLAKAGLYRMFRTGQRLKFDVLPRHFYSSIPDFRELSSDPSWKKPMSLIGVAGSDPDEQLAFLATCCSDELRSRLGAMDLDAYARAQEGSAGFGPIEAEVLYCFIGSKRPARIVQVGAGFSTAVMLKAAADVGHKMRLTCVEPYPSEHLKRLNREGQIALIAQRAQVVDLEALTNLGAGDLLFIDSTHTVKVGGEVNRIILEVLPRLSAGVYVHFHDIYFPYDYNRSLMEEPFFPLESTLLHAFLVNNPRYTIRAALSMLHYARPAEFQALVPKYCPQQNDEGLPRNGDETGHFPSSIYLQVI